MRSRGLFFTLLILSFIYAMLPLRGFPRPPEGAFQSNEPADTESIYRRAYYTNYSRGEIMKHYKERFFSFPGIIQIRLNHPPEDAATVIRDQARSSYLEELVHPLREILYVNGFEPTKPTEEINIGQVHYKNKITVRYVPSGVITRFTTWALIFISINYLLKEYA